MLFNTYQKKIPHLLKKQRKRKEKYNVKDYDMMVKKIEKIKLSTSKETTKVKDI